MTYEATIGLEIHAELKTKTKMFCNSKNDADEERPNWNVCPVCLAHPGTLPVINREAVRKVLQVGLALGGKLADYTEFDRKNYFYPDLPKGYQISQYAYPLVSGGTLSGVEITRVHLEEDTASSMHDDASGATTIDFNRSGVPLMELVTEPVIRSAEEAGAFARELQLLLRYLGASEANMEKGEMRVEANISVAKIDGSGLNGALGAVGRTRAHSERVLGTKVEVKNLNSFRIMEKAVAYEIKRQQELLERGEKVKQETRGWDDAAGATFSQRVKEGSADYRYFPDPDLPSLKLSQIPEFDPEGLRKAMPELPGERRERYLALGIKGEDAELYVREGKLGRFFEQVIDGYSKGAREILLASNYIANDLVSIISSFAKATKDRRISRFRGLARDMEERDSEIQHEVPISPENFRKIINMVAGNKISSRSAKDLIVHVITDKEDPEEIAKKRELFQVSSAAGLETVVADVIAKNPKVVADYKAGKEAALEFLVGQCMKALRGAADPVALRELLVKNLS
ncbi:MAG: Asp-tRNA(Asn)/Glu-tRNA(Gln) amidotransferase subunit GatB [bacterium]|nr:Asp-tRNA(Asn)/Glu-tRNA(Gln) amidotransferase subunit GatB [bacterium]